MTSPDKREHPRIKINQTISVADENNLLLAEVEDITVGGILLRSEGQITLGTKFYVVFPGAGEIQENEVEAEVIRAEMVANTNSFKYRIAARFLNANEKYIKDALEIIKN